MSELWVASTVAQWAIIVGLAFIVVGLARQLGLVQLRLGIDPGVLITKRGLHRGAQGPDFEAPDVRNGAPVRLSQFRGRRVGLVFVTPTCMSCRELVPHLNRFADERRSELDFVAIMYGSGRACSEFARRFKLRIPLLADPENSLAQAYDVVATPFAYLLDEEGVVLIRGVVNSWPHLEALLNEEGTHQHSEAPWDEGAPDVGAPGLPTVVR